MESGQDQVCGGVDAGISSSQEGGSDIIKKGLRMMSSEGPPPIPFLKEWENGVYCASCP